MSHYKGENKMNEQQVFSLYLANEGQMVSYDNGTTKGTYKLDWQNLKNVKLEMTKLLLKDIADMSEGDKNKCRDLMLTGLEDKYNVIPKGFFDYNKWHYYHTPESVFYLITHGYCINDEWVKLGYVEIVKAGE